MIALALLVYSQLNISEINEGIVIDVTQPLRSNSPSVNPSTSHPSILKIMPSTTPTKSPMIQPSTFPSLFPSFKPSIEPTIVPTLEPSQKIYEVIS